MKKFRIIYYEVLKFQPANLELLKNNFDLIILPNPNADTEELLVQADVIFAPLGYYFGKEKIDQSKKLKVIGSNTTGDSHIDVNYAQEKGIKVITLKGEREFLKNITSTAELTFGLIIVLTRKIFPAYQSVLGGVWDRRPFGGISMLSKMNLGIVGFGRLGSLVASYGQCFGMKVRFYDPYVSLQPPGVERISNLKDLVKLSDVVSIHIPYEPETKNMFNEEIFSNFKKGSYLINTSRGEIIDNEALLKYLKKGILAGAALDVLAGEFEPNFEEKLRENPLLKYAKEHDNLIITPHIGGSTIDAWSLTEKYVIKKIIQYLNIKN